MHARTQKPLTQHTHPSHFKGLSQKYSYTNSSEWNPLPKRMSSSLLFVWEYEALRCGIHRQMGAFFSLSVSLLRFCSHTRCCSVFCVHCGSCGFWHSENNNHSSSVQTDISCQKHRRRCRSSHRKWEDDSGRVPLHWKKKITITITLTVNTNKCGEGVSQCRDNRRWSRSFGHRADAFWSTAERKPLIASALWAAVTKFRAGRALFFLKS